MPRQVTKMLSQMGSGLLMGQEEITASSLRRVVWLARGARTSGYLLNNRGSFLFSIHLTGPRMGFFFSFSSKFYLDSGKDWEGTGLSWVETMQSLGKQSF